MLKKFGYTNATMLVVLAAMTFTWIDFNELTTANKVFLAVFGLIIITHLVRIIMIIYKRKVGEK